MLDSALDCAARSSSETRRRLNGVDSFHQRHLTVGHLIVVLAGIAVAIVVATVFGLGGRSGASLVIYHKHPDPDPRIKVIEVDPAGDAGKAGDVHGVMGQRLFEIPVSTFQASDDQLRFVFTAPAQILQVDISVDIADPRATLVEFAAGINARRGYGQYRSADWLMHASWSRYARNLGEIDETAVLPDGVEVAAGDFVGIGAFLGGVGSGDPIRMSPEVVVLYRWLDGAQ